MGSYVVLLGFVMVLGLRDFNILPKKGTTLEGLGSYQCHPLPQTSRQKASNSPLWEPRWHFPWFKLCSFEVGTTPKKEPLDFFRSPKICWNL